MSNTITAYFKGRVGVAESVYQNDYGIVMVFDSIDLPAHFDCYFSVPGSDTSTAAIGADNRVVIPNSVLGNSGSMTVHIPLHTGENDSEVEYVVYFKVIGRARPEDDGTPTQMTAIERALALLSQPITNIEEIVNEALSFTGDTFAEMKQELQDDFDNYTETLEGDLATWKGGVESDFDNLEAQFDTAVAAVTTDTEVTNIRVGDDKVTYTTAGEAVRTQFANVKSDIDYFEDNTVIAYDDLTSYLYKKDTYINSSFIETPLSGYDTFKIPLEAFDVLYVSWENSFWGGLTYSLAVTILKTDNSYVRPNNNTSAGYYNLSVDNKMLWFGAIPNISEIAAVFITTKADLTLNAKVAINKPHIQFANDVKTVYDLTSLSAIDSTLYYRGTSDFGDFSSPYSCKWVKLNGGDKVAFKKSITGVVGNARIINNDGTVDLISDSVYTASDSCILCIYDNSTVDGEILLYPNESIKISADNIIGDVANRKILNGKVWCSFGDSITAQNKWQPQIVETLGGTHQNCGIGSSPLGGSDANAFWRDSRLNTVKATYANIVTILGGANDLALNVPVGTEANLVDKDTSTFIGAYSYIIDNLMTWKPTLKIFILSTTYAHNNGTDISQTLTYDMYADACKMVAEYYHLPYVDLYNQSGFNQYTMGSNPYNVYSLDHIHPNADGANIVASMVLEKFKEILQFS